MDCRKSEKRGHRIELDPIRSATAQMIPNATLASCLVRVEIKGESWSTPVEISSFLGNCIDDDGTAEGAVPAYGTKNEVYVGWALDQSIWMSS